MLETVAGLIADSRTGRMEPQVREALLEATLQLADIGYCEWDYVNRRLVNCSVQYARIYGMEVDEILASQQNWQTVVEQIHPDDRARYIESYESSFARGSRDISYRITRSDGAIRHVREISVLVGGDDNADAKSMSLLQDVTTTREREEEIDKRDQLVRQVETITEIGHFIWDLSEEVYKYISPGFARIHGVSVEEYMARVNSWQDDIADVHEDDRDWLTEFYDKNDVNENDYIVEYRIRRADGQIRWLLEQTTVMQDTTSETSQSIGVLRDITEQKGVELGLREARDNLEAQVAHRTRELAQTIERLEQEMSERVKVSNELENRNAELERFTYTVSHDLKAPLVTIKGFLGLLNQDIEARDFDRVGDDMEKINTAADTMGSLLNDLLELSRIGRIMNEPESCDLSELARHASEVLTSRVDALEVRITIDEMPAILGDKTRLLEVFQNLIENGLKFMGDQTSPEIQIGASECGDMIRCHVRDNGIGIDAQYLQQVFGLFERLNANVSGTGIGLALAKRIIEVHGGEIWVESAGPGHGSSFFFTLPLFIENQ